ncbi:unnamed protein product [Rhizophagus irregularis]|uniref:P-loop containing nucleoside triphosphate hydrolase protein n=1 Tax=Rhizophagus irregularis TaxID=588596 RepID=A0A915ZZT4_9GLOM|nr:unnamed protein product [Rhizophagus irregularis]
MTSEERTLEELLREILRLNYDKPKICDLVNEGILSVQVNKVMKAFENDSEVFPQGNEIKYWNKVNIRNWADSIKGTEITKNPEFLEEMIAVLKRTNFLYCKHNLRITQVLAILLFVSPNEQGRLLQISTGEGKTTICAMLASIKVLQGENVDIITSSPILAKRDAEERESFYKILGISCGSNEGEDYSLSIVDGRNGIQLETNKNCYFKNIVYGNVSEFQFDWLKHEYKKIGTKGNRGFGVVIVDEVDTMIIDDCSRSARLTGELAGFEYLNPVFCGVANELTRLSKRIIWTEENLIYLDGEFKEEGEELILEEEIKCYEINNWYEFISEYLTEFTINIIKKRKIELPDFLRDFCLKSVEEFVKSAIESWNIKHGLKLTPESVATSFVSNMGYFKKYGAKIYGLTGTIGSKEDQDMLSSIYTVDFGFMPTYKAKKFKELEGIVTSNKNAWIMEVVSNIKQEGERGRAVLVICETIDNVKTIYDILIEVYSTRKIRLYSRNDNDECSAVKERVNSGDVIIATNLAGRGTDIKTSFSVEKNGGLHVIVTFLPSNSRVEKQAFGRTARQGAKGIAQLIINKIYTENKLNTTGILSNIQWTSKKMHQTFLKLLIVLIKSI